MAYRAYLARRDLPGLGVARAATSGRHRVMLAAIYSGWLRVFYGRLEGREEDAQRIQQDEKIDEGEGQCRIRSPRRQRMCSRSSFADDLLRPQTAPSARPLFIYRSQQWIGWDAGTWLEVPQLLRFLIGPERRVSTEWNRRTRPSRLGLGHLHDRREMTQAS